MTLIIQKYDSTYVASIETIQTVAQHICQTTQAGNSVVVVVPAMVTITNPWIEFADEISANPKSRERDMLLAAGEQVSIALLTIALQELGQSAISLTGAQIGMVTEAEHTCARLLHIQTERIKRHLNDGQVVVVTGFQGIGSTEELEITTLGRGGLDTSAVALAAVLQASRCEIYTGTFDLFTADPRIVPDAQLLDEITCDEMLELASLGGKVLHPRAVEMARKYGVLLVVRSSLTDAPSTRVISSIPKSPCLQGLEIARPVEAVEVDTTQAKVSLLHVPDYPGVAAYLFSEVARQELDVDLIIQSIHTGNTNDIAFSVSKSAIERAEVVADMIIPNLHTQWSVISKDDSNFQLSSSEPQKVELMVDRQIVKISIIGVGMMARRPGIAAQMFATLAEANINIQMISTSDVRVSCIINAADCDRAIAALCQTFQVNSSQLLSVTNTSNQLFLDTLPVRGVALDCNQARLAICDVPNQVGVAAKLFEPLAQQNISVDMIVQSGRCRVIDGVPTRDIAFTLPQMDVGMARLTLEKAVSDLVCGEIVVEPAIAKVSAVGIGMIGRPGVAACMFEALAKRQINIQMIATSEISISCVVAEHQGTLALQAIHAAFGLSGLQNIRDRFTS
ncbi:aspartate kinase [Microcoleus sp. FACHB-SPT15]|uniref:aspartate kinase n=1 Tax=Microcoleus sp. FACHB-SPT15 TaxID=2692830 RepID=UPI00178283C9|nr:aspartate kinase [Microcoleus sp. FACHB-SPT15]MBD1803895.1 aspartate kinase [Microcoleus sp. FACHB-SPT15]